MSRLLSRPGSAWQRLSLSVQFLIAAALVLGVAMLLLGNWVSDRIQASSTRGAAESGAIFLQSFLQPYVQDLPASGALPPEVVDRLNRIIQAKDTLDRFIMLKIWRLDAALLYSSNANVRPAEAAEEEIQTAASGKLARHFEELDEELLGIAPEDNITLLEVYAPLYRTGTDEIIAVGEFYQSAVGLINEQAASRTLTWLVVAAITICMLSILFLIVTRGSRTIQSQRQSLERQFAEATVLASQNNKLRKVAEQARIAASESNENFLSRIGSDIHDGPIQTLSLLMASLQYGRDGEAEGGRVLDLPPDPRQLNTIQLAKAVYAELRNISTGLVLPEIATAHLTEVFEIAISRYESATGASVASRIKPLPESAPLAVKICSYRVVQEALNNGFRHAGGKDQRVEVGASVKQLTIIVSDEGPGISSDADRTGRHAPLGMLGMQNRVMALKGKLSVHSRPGAGTRVTVTIPLDPAAE